MPIDFVITVEGMDRLPDLNIPYQGKNRYWRFQYFNAIDVKIDNKKILSLLIIKRKRQNIKEKNPKVEKCSIQVVKKH